MKWISTERATLTVAKILAILLIVAVVFELAEAVR